MMDQQHKHRAIPSQQQMRGYRGQALGSVQNRRAHGGVLYIDRCACGAIRETNANGGTTERGVWTAERGET